MKQSADVLHEHDFRSQLANKSIDLKPQSAPVASKPLLMARVADVLAREPAADDINVNSVSAKSVGCECSDIVVLPHVGPMLRQHLAAEGINLAERDRLEPASAFQAKVETADSCE